MKQLKLTVLALLLGSASVFAQQTVEGGIKGGATFTNGHTTIPAVPINAALSVPQIENKGTGTGVGYSFGIWARKNFNGFFVQVEADYNRFVLKQQAAFSVPAVLAASLAGTTLPAQVPATTPTAIALTSESVLESVNVPILFGKKFANERLRAYIGPNLLFTNKATATRQGSGTLLGQNLPLTATTSDLKKPNPASPTESVLEVKPFTYAAEVGLGYTIGNLIDIDARYAVPVGGIYKNKDIKGYLGIATLSVGVKLF